MHVCVCSDAQQPWVPESLDAQYLVLKSTLGSSSGIISCDMRACPKEDMARPQQLRLMSVCLSDKWQIGLGLKPPTPTNPSGRRQ